MQIESTMAQIANAQIVLALQTAKQYIEKDLESFVECCSFPDGTMPLEDERIACEMREALGSIEEALGHCEKHVDSSRQAAA